MNYCIFLDFLCELYYDARIHEHHVFYTWFVTWCLYLALVSKRGI